MSQHYIKSKLPIAISIKLESLYLASWWTKQGIYPIVVGKLFTPNEDDSQKVLSFLFKILVLLDTISDWPWWVSWQHFYTQSLPTRNTGNTAWLPCRHATPYKYYSQILVASTFKRTGAWGKSQSRQIYVFDLNLVPQHPTRRVFVG